GPDIKPNRGNAYDQHGRTDEAVAAYRKALELDTGNAIVRNNLANLYSKQGLYDEAARELEDLVQRDPANATAKANLENALKSRAVMQERKDQASSAVQGPEPMRRIHRPPKKPPRRSRRSVTPNRPLPGPTKPHARGTTR